MDDSSSSFIHPHRDDSGYGSPIFTGDFSSPHQPFYYTYQHPSSYQNNSFHMYEQQMTSSYNGIDPSMTLPFEPPAVARPPVPSPQPVCIDSSTPSKTNNSLDTTNLGHPFDCPVNWVPPHGRRRRQRTVFTQNNVLQLDSIFIHNQYPDIELRERLATHMGVPESRIQVWFKNRRTRARTAQRQQQFQMSHSSSSH